MFHFRKIKYKGKEKQDVRRKENESNKDSFSDMCAKHPEKTLDIFCSQCDQVYCRECIDTGLHEEGTGKHHELKFVTDVAYEYEDSMEFKEYDKRMIELRKKLQRSCDKTADNFKLSNKLQQEAEDRIKNQKEKLIDLIETRFHEILAGNEKRKNDCLTKLENIDKQNNELMTQFDNIEKEINEKKKKVVTAFIAIKRSKQMIERIEEGIKELNKRNTVSRYVFNAGEQALTFMKKISDFGKLEDDNLNSLERSIEISTEGSQNNDYFERAQRNRSRRSYSTIEGPFSENSGYLTPETTDTAITTTISEQISENEVSFSASSDSHEVPSHKIDQQQAPLRRHSESIYHKPSDSTVRDPSPQNNTIHEHEQSKGSAVRDPSPQNSSMQEHERTIGSTGPPKPAPKPSTEALRQARERISMRRSTNRSVARQSQQSERNQTKLEKHKVLYSYTPVHEDDLSVVEGDIVTVLQKCTDGWYHAELNGNQGYIPKSYLEKTSIKNKLENMFPPPKNNFT